MGTIVARIGRAILLLAVVAQTCSSADTLINIREPNRSITLPVDLPISGYGLVDACPNLTFAQPIALISPPSETNIYRAELVGQQ